MFTKIIERFYPKEWAENPQVEGKESCKTCRFWFKEGLRPGTCRRYPPVDVINERVESFIHSVKHEFFVSKLVFPTPPYDLWCGEYKRKRKE